MLKKVRKIEETGAAFAIIIDTNKEDNITQNVMIDDSSSADLRITFILISDKNGQIFIDFLKRAPKENSNSLILQQTLIFRVSKIILNMMHSSDLLMKKL